MIQIFFPYLTNEEGLPLAKRFTRLKFEVLSRFQCFRFSLVSVNRKCEALHQWRQNKIPSPALDCHATSRVTHSKDLLLYPLL